MAEYVANTVVEIPKMLRKGTFGEPVYGSEPIRKEPGDKITLKEFTDNGQTEEQFKELVKYKSIIEAPKGDEG